MQTHFILNVAMVQFALNETKLNNLEMTIKIPIHFHNNSLLMRNYNCIEHFSFHVGSMRLPMKSSLLSTAIHDT